MSDKPRKSIKSQISESIVTVKPSSITLEDIIEAAEYIFKNLPDLKSTGLCIIKIRHGNGWLSFDFSREYDNGRRLIAKTGIGGFNNLLKLGIVDMNTIYYNGVKYEGEVAKKIIEQFTDEET